MPQRLTATEAALLAADTRTTPQHVGSVDIFVAEDLDVDAVAELIERRLEFIPRYRMRPRAVPGGIALPVWVEDAHFDPSFHIRHSALPRPGSLRQLDEFVGRVLARGLDLSRPLWECYIVEGLQADPASGLPRFALVTKSHLALVDGIDGVELGQVLLDDPSDLLAHEDEDEDHYDGRRFEPMPEPRPLDLVVDAVREGLSGPKELLRTGQRGLGSALNTAVTVGEAVLGGNASSVGDWAESTLRRSRGPAGTPLGGVPSQHRRFAHVQLELSELKALRQNPYTVNDVLLAVVTGGLRGWLAAGGRRAQDLLALVPMGVGDQEDGDPSALGAHVAPHLISLPLSESNPLMRVHQISHGTRAHTDTGVAISARTITDIAGFAPMTLQALAVRTAATLVLRPHHLLVTNAPGPQRPLELAGATMTASYPVLPIEPGRLLSIGMTSYNSVVYIGLSADRDQVPDLDLLASCLRDAVGELQAAAEDARPQWNRSNQEDQ